MSTLRALLQHSYGTIAILLYSRCSVDAVDGNGRGFSVAVGALPPLVMVIKSMEEFFS